MPLPNGLQPLNGIRLNNHVTGELPQPPSGDKLEELADSYWATKSKEQLENQTRQHFLARSRYIAEQSATRLPYPSVYGTQGISEYCWEDRV